MPKCHDCGKVSRFGNMPTAKIDNQERSYCADCYWKLEKQYKQKKTCDDCSYFIKDRCSKNDVKLVPAMIGYTPYFVQAENCKNYSDNKDEALGEIKKLEAAGKYEDAACAYEKLGMDEEAEKVRKKEKHKTPAAQGNINTLVENLVKSGQTLTYYCTFCGRPLKIGAKSPKVHRTCPYCGGGLEIIDLARFIRQRSKT